MSSLTWWNRLEPRPRSADLARALEAQVRDPAWFLARQWQFGEFRAEDAASPGFVQLSHTTAPFVGWRVPGKASTALPTGQPLEETVETEAFSPDLALRVELGQTFEMLLAKHGASAAVVKAFRMRYGFSVAMAGSADSADPEGTRFARVCEGRAIDGYRVYVAFRAVAPAYPDPVPSLSGADAALACQALDDLKVWIEDLYDAVGTTEAPAWRQERLEYDVEVVATRPDDGVTVLTADPDREATFDWYAFDERTGASDPMNPGQLTTSRSSVLPIHVRFRGMPNRRFWDLESGQVNFGGIESDKRDLARMMVAYFMLVQGNDWFMLPLELPVGSLCHVDSLVVHDVFGGLTLVERADRDPAPAGERWTMFSTTAGDSARGYADYFILPPSAAGVLQSSAPIEAVHMLRDQMANMAWAVEHETENDIGLARSGHEREFAAQAEVGVTTNQGDGAPLRWVIQTPMPRHWIPLVPAVIDPLIGDVALLPGSLVRPGSGGLPETPAPKGRILKPGVRIAEEEVSRAGTRVRRLICASRWTDGSTHLWVARQKSAGAGEGSSGLRFDQAEIRRAPS
jgi:hypothetical protein